MKIFSRPNRRLFLGIALCGTPSLLPGAAPNAWDGAGFYPLATNPASARPWGETGWTLGYQDSPSDDYDLRDPAFSTLYQDRDWAIGAAWVSGDYGPPRADGSGAGTWFAHLQGSESLGWAGRWGWRYRFEPQALSSHHGDMGWWVEPFGVLRAGLWANDLLASGRSSDPSFHWEAGLRPFGFTRQAWNRLEVSAQGTWDEDTVQAALALPLSRGVVVSAGMTYPGTHLALGLELPLTARGTFFLGGRERPVGPQRRSASLRMGPSRTRTYALPTASAVVLDLNTAIVLSSAAGLREDETDLESVLAAIRGIDDDTRIRRVLVRLGRLRCGFAAAQELRRALLSLQRDGREVWAHVENASPLNYYVASAASSVSAPPSAAFAAKGLAAEQTFWTGLMNKVGVEAQVLKRGPYKSFPEPFTREGWSPEAREDLTALLGGLWGVLVGDIARSRGLDSVATAAKLAAPELSMDSALAWGFVDTLVYADEARKWASGESAAEDGAGGTGGAERKFAWKELPERPEEFRWGNEVVIPVVDLSGEIVMGQSRGPGLAGGSVLGHESVAGLLETLEKDDRVEVVILRVDSPGGSAEASELMWRAIRRLREKGKRVVVSLGNVAASGGYFLASAGDTLLVERGGVVGSIGVVWGKVVLQKAYGKLDLTSETVATGPHADATSWHRPWTEEEQEAYRRHLEQFYATFRKCVTEGRGERLPDFDAVAEGRIFTGEKAVAVGLADALGGLEEAKAIARRWAGVGSHQKVSYPRLEPQGGWLEAGLGAKALARWEGSASPADEWARWVDPRFWERYGQPGLWAWDLGLSGLETLK